MDLDWFQAKDVGPTGKFHAAIWVQPGPGCNYQPRGLCAAPVILELDKKREFNPYCHTDRKCKACLKELTVPGHDPQDGINEYEYGDLPIGRRTASKPSKRELSKRELLERRLERHRREADVLESTLATLDALPNEPEVEDGEPNVVWFTKVFRHGSKEYIYAAVKAGDGLWYTTGPNVPKGYTWDRLIEWITDGESSEVWHAIAYDAVT